MNAERVSAVKQLILTGQPPPHYSKDKAFRLKRFVAANPFTLRGPDRKLYVASREVLASDDQAAIDAVLKRVWKDPRVGGFSVQKLYGMVRQAYFGISREAVHEWLKRQPAYQVAQKRERALFRPTRADARGHCNVDLTFMTDWRAGKNNNYTGLVVVQDFFSKFLWAEPIRKKSSAEVARALHKMFVGTGWIPKSMRSDQGGEFGKGNNGAIGTADLAASLNIAWQFTRAYASRSNGQVERANQTLKRLLWRLGMQRNSERWIDLLPEAVMSYNQQVHASTGYPPAVLHYGGYDSRAQLLRDKPAEKTTLPGDALSAEKPPDAMTAEQIKEAVAEINAGVSENEKRAREGINKAADAMLKDQAKGLQALKVGDKVRVSTYRDAAVRRRAKLATIREAWSRTVHVVEATRTTDDGLEQFRVSGIDTWLPRVELLYIPPDTVAASDDDDEEEKEDEPVMERPRRERKPTARALASAAGQK